MDKITLAKRLTYLSYYNKSIEFKSDDSLIEVELNAMISQLCDLLSPWTDDSYSSWNAPTLKAISIFTYGIARVYKENKFEIICNDKKYENEVELIKNELGKL